MTDLSNQTSRDLFALFVATMDELKRRGITRSKNNPLADYAELLFVRALNLTQAPKSTKGYDATDTTGKKYEVKGRRIVGHKASRQMSALRGLEKKHFDYLAGVLLEEDFSVFRACLIPHEQVLRLSTHVKHTNSWRFLLRDSVWLAAGVIDVTEEIRLAAAEIDSFNIANV